jgi:hypothetical protein
MAAVDKDFNRNRRPEILIAQLVVCHRPDPDSMIVLVVARTVSRREMSRGENLTHTV